ncbi:39S ribosomal protein L19, mitochondrial [Tympanuchus pallidicinctus]|uniref:39S ribosomal protein L19, mitochondrial n=1 Tax=Tympanuchus pallidicinctus TaxID=109042 RepID=UPI00228762B0|nr:39S ribosomal protein L19, mitochondrial [Tympanuchus pallidicinctus]
MAAACGRALLQGVRPVRWFSSSTCRMSSDGEPTKFQPPPKPVIIDKQKQREERRFLSPEFIPPRGRTDPLKFYIERKDMIQRRKVFNIPEFYVGSILAVTTADPYADGKTNRFVGICIQRGGRGLGATFVLRNVIEDQGVEICYELYSPRIQEITVLKLEKRLDDNLMYLRDALPEYSTFDMNMKPVSHLDHEEIPVNKLQVRMKPKPWSKRWERPKYNIKGIKFELPEKTMKEAQKWKKPWLEFDMLREYDTSKIEEKIWREVSEELRK